MNKKIIQLIIGALTVAVIGLVALQTDLILASVRANEEAFDKNVQNAMSIVAEKIERAAKSEDILPVINGYSAEYLINGASEPRDENGGITIPSYGDKIIEELLIAHRSEGLGFQKIEGLTFQFIDTNRPIEDRVDAEVLVKILSRELQNNAINSDFEFGVYSNVEKAFIIYNGQYVKLDSNDTRYSNAYLNLHTSPYKVTLFETKEGKTAGNLKLCFPERHTSIWRRLLPSFIGTFLFTAIILACFVYTFWVIFHQKRLSEMKTDFINNMTHEFKTPIATISLAADSILNPRISGDISKLTRFINIIKQENKRMNNQVEKVLQIAQIDREDSKLLLTDVNLHEIIHRAIENIGLQVEKRNGTAKAILDATQPIVMGDQTHISNVINNLLDNANKYSPDTPHITVRTKNLAEGLEVMISDKGMGLSKEARKHIFDKFYRVHTGDRHDIKGFGLGLSYVKTIMIAHKGSIEVKSMLNKGSDFILFFPYEGSNT